MQNTIPSAEEVRTALLKLSHAQTKALATAADVPFTTLWKVRSGETPNPRLETVRQFWPHVASAAVAEPPPACAPEPAAAQVS